MAGDWIPMRVNLEDDPTVIFIARATSLSADHVVGKLHHFWSWADSHTEDGSFPGVGADWVDAHVKKKGFAKAMASAPYPWLKISRAGVSIPNFDNWFGSSAKRRLKDTERKRSVRNSSASCPQGERTKTGPQYSTEEKSILSPALDDADWISILKKIRPIAESLGGCGSARNKKLLLGACALSRCDELGAEWFDTAVDEMREGHAEKPFAYLHSILKRTAEQRGVDFLSSLSSLKVPSQSARATQPEEQPCQS